MVDCEEIKPIQHYMTAEKGQSPVTKFISSDHDLKFNL